MLSNYSDLLGIVGLIVGIFGLVYGLSADMKLNKANKNLEKIGRDVSTKELPGFPRNLPSISELVGGTTAGELRIMADICGYALYSDPAGSTAYVRELKEAIDRGVHIRMLVYSHDAAQGSMRRQIPEAKYYQEVRAGKGYKHYVAFYNLAEDMDYDQFVRSAMDQEKMTRRDLVAAGVNCRPLAQVRTAFLWLSSTPAVALFALRNDATSMAGLSFRTEATSFLSEFGKVFEEEWELSAKSNVSAVW